MAQTAEYPRKESGPSRPPRFERRYRAGNARRQGMRRWLTLGGGIALLVFGVIMVPAPGPGLPIAFLGAGLIAEQSLWAARLLDKWELAVKTTIGKLVKASRARQ